MTRQQARVDLKGKHQACALLRDYLATWCPPGMQEACKVRLDVSTRTPWSTDNSESSIAPDQELDTPMAEVQTNTAPPVTKEEALSALQRHFTSLAKAFASNTRVVFPNAFSLPGLAVKDDHTDFEICAITSLLETMYNHLQTLSERVSLACLPGGKITLSEMTQ